MSTKTCTFGCGATFDTLGEINSHYKSDHGDAWATRKAANREKREREAGTAGRVRAPRVTVSTTKNRTGPVGFADDDTETVQSEPERLPGFAHTETAPAPSKPSLRDRLRSRKAAPGAPAPTRERKPQRPARRRVSTAKVLGEGWGAIGFGLARFGVDEPVGRVMQFQGPAAGEVLEGLTKGTPFDRPAQYVAQRAEEVGAAKNLFELPLLVFMYQRATPDLAQMLAPMLRAAIQRNFVAMVPVVRKQREEEARWREAVAELGLEGDDPVGDMLAAIFGGDIEDPASASDVTA